MIADNNLPPNTNAISRKKNNVEKKRDSQFSILFGVTKKKIFFLKNWKNI